MPASPTHVAVTAVLLVAVLVAPGCDNTTEPDIPLTSGLEPGDIIQVEGSLNWFTNSVSWFNQNEQGRVPRDRYALISISQRAAQNGPSHFLYDASVNASCNDALCRPGGDVWVDAEWTINELDWSPVGARFTCEGRERQGQTNGPAKVIVVSSDGGNRKDWGRGLMPSFSRDGGRIAHVTQIVDDLEDRGLAVKLCVLGLQHVQAGHQLSAVRGMPVEDVELVADLLEFSGWNACKLGDRRVIGNHRRLAAAGQRQTDKQN